MDRSASICISGPAGVTFDAGCSEFACAEDCALAAGASDFQVSQPRGGMANNTKNKSRFLHFAIIDFQMRSTACLPGNSTIRRSPVSAPKARLKLKLTNL